MWTHKQSEIITNGFFIGKAVGGHILSLHPCPQTSERWGSELRTLASNDVKLYCKLKHWTLNVLSLKCIFKQILNEAPFSDCAVLCKAVWYYPGGSRTRLIAWSTEIETQLQTWKFKAASMVKAYPSPVCDKIMVIIKSVSGIME